MASTWSQPSSTTGRGREEADSASLAVAVPAAPLLVPLAAAALAAARDAASRSWAWMTALSSALLSWWWDKGCGYAWNARVVGVRCGC